jgi:hypothetical protein
MLSETKVVRVSRRIFFAKKKEGGFGQVSRPSGLAGRPVAKRARRLRHSIER